MLICCLYHISQAGERRGFVLGKKKPLVLIPASMKAYGCTCVSHLSVAPEEDPSCSPPHHDSRLVSTGDSKLGEFGRYRWGVMGTHKVPSRSARAAGISSHPWYLDVVQAKPQSSPRAYRAAITVQAQCSSLRSWLQDIGVQSQDNTQEQSNSWLSPVQILDWTDFFCQ